MLFVENRENINTLQSMGLTKNNIFNIFFLEGLLISGAGILLGLIVGYTVCLVQQEFGLLKIPGAGMPFPVKLALKDFFLVLISLSTLSVLFSYFPVKFLLKNLQK